MVRTNNIFTKNNRMSAHRRLLRKTPVAVSLLLALSPFSAFADNYFNPAFLTGLNGASTDGVADLSRFEKNQQAPGNYRVDVYLNNNYITRRNVTFNAATTKSSGTEVHNADADNAAAAGQPVSDTSNNAEEQTTTSDGTGIVACITVKNLEVMGVAIKAFPELAKLAPDDCVDLPSAIKDASTSLDFEHLRLDISIPQAALSNSARGYIPPSQWDQGIPAFLLNYNFNGSHNEGDSTTNNYFLSLNGGLNFGAWRLRDTSNWNYSTGKHGENATHDWQHVSTYIERTIIALKGELVAGDSNTSSDVFDSLGFRGVQLASDDNMLPDSMKGFAPTIRGIAKSNAQVTIKQNGYKIYQTSVPPGAFVIDDLYPTSSSGDLTVSVEEADGSINTFTVPYSTVPILQREGRVKYALTAGKFRSGSSDEDDPSFVQATAIWGVSKGFTLYGGAQYSENYNAWALGVGKNLGEWGGLSVDVTQANSVLADDSEHHGSSVRFLYAKSLNSWGTDFQLLGYRYSTKGYYTLEDTTLKMMEGYNDPNDENKAGYVPTYSDYYNLYYTKRGQIQLNLSQSIGEEGSIYITASNQSYWHTDETTSLLQVGYSGVWKDINYGLNYSYNKATEQEHADRVFSFNVSLPISKWLMPGGDEGSSHNATYATYSGNVDAEGKMTQQAGISGTLLRDNNLSYSVQQGYSNHDGEGYNGMASMNYQGAYGNSNVSYSYSKGYRQLNYGLSGGVVVHQHGVTLSQPLGETNILVAAPGAKGIDVENQTGVKTDWRGYAVLPYGNDYRLNRIALDTTTLNDHTDIDEAVTTVVPTKGALVQASFKARVGVRAMLIMTHNGKPLPFGTTVSTGENNNAGIVGDDGQVYLSGLQLNGKLTAQWGDSADKQCKANYQLPKDSLTQSIVRATIACN
ncbi:fimbrial biogenesis usher protein [Scandinavium sp. V105_16]|uniref:Fimbrial biogenesis usher protein n=1 Tax=Scandinavium lactucae TaxID=3095028 RepID=A0AAJ2S8J0_9ENTR|nr:MULTISPECIES: fimbrial biogenesis usher protein [unclassified Scandinavium]MDX6020476.1 fimbrial biogenesis usher protein [Scandinavium sp. V105_16]MDX6031972.1 fimbrial biogenesis usher protein [Scandinavium sp. V105_12]MDX6039830.1 fimbrial biogenesis usher protein [Scandinavium sp. V105_6]MDX6051437.1 fimbrial biogenesis usher protein [Scandinavium sp. V105_1]